MIDLELRTAVLRALRDIEPGDTVAVGLSGGADSTALLRGAVQVGNELGWRVAAVIVDHQLQQGSGDVAARAAGIAGSLGAHEVHVVAVDVRPAGEGIESAARDARRRVFEGLAAQHGWPAVLLGHTRDDQAETVLLGLARGSGARSLSGMRAVDGLYRRPLLGLRRERVRAAVSDLDTVEDPHNTDDRFSRARVRATVLPMLEAQLGPGIADSLSRTADMLRDDADALDALAADSATSDVLQLADLPRAVRTRVLRALALAAGCPANDLTRDHVLAIESLVTDWHGQGPVNLPGGVDCRRAGGKLMLTPRSR